MKNLEIKYNPDDRIIYITKEGKITHSETKVVLHKLLNEFGKFDTVYILEDSRNSQLEISLGEMREFFLEIKKLTRNRREVRHADLVDTPFETAMGVIFQQMVAPLKSYKYRCFSTDKAALEWLKKGKFYSPGDEEK
ncbi:STAS/SEC14 domain-containing protein [uncultured Draconibacterium sp.]|uniref:STAS/SEC14 domain-containing protein n=1 Tax=uncultured Draconibacterium sp. TaxID=1573823 RepID=UPI0025D5BA06|nr:STAS/SEC14 domain-containing protein [uncultured Draconibacterium sp.]